MSHEVYRLLGSIYNQPHLILESALAPIVDYLAARNAGGIQLAVVPTEKQVKPKAEQVANIGEIRIDGTLTYAPVHGACGATEGTSYQGILDQAAELISLGADTIILTHNSPGGQAQMAFDCAASLRDMCDESGVQLISYVETMSASASYLIACVSDVVVCHPEAVVGSIGATIAILERAKQMEMAGVKPIYISSTAGKVPFNQDGTFTEKFLTRMQNEVTSLGNKFVQHVSDNTGIKTEDILALDAEMFHAEEALSIGLINSVMTKKEFAQYLADNKGNK